MAEPQELAEKLAAYVAWEPPCEVDVSKPARALGLIRAAFFAGWEAHAALRASQQPGGDSAEPDLTVVYMAGSEQGREGERAKIAAWLRALPTSMDYEYHPELLADAIERGDHRTALAQEASRG